MGNEIERIADGSEGKGRGSGLTGSMADRACSELGSEDIDGAVAHRVARRAIELLGQGVVKVSGLDRVQAHRAHHGEERQPAAPRRRPFQGEDPCPAPAKGAPAWNHAVIRPTCNGLGIPPWSAGLQRTATVQRIAMCNRNIGRPFRCEGKPQAHQIQSIMGNGAYCRSTRRCLANTYRPNRTSQTGERGRNQPASTPTGTQRSVARGARERITVVTSWMLWNE